jgi:hypothetical protein
MDLFEHVTDSIGRAYTELGHTLGWRFLYTSARTLSADAPILFAGLNPGGSYYWVPQPSVEAGNTYRIECWADGNRFNPLQLQVQVLYERIAQQLSRSDPDTLMDTSLSANFCPFRSPSWETLPTQAASVEFSRWLWTTVLQHIAPPTMICLTDAPFRYFREVLQNLGYTERELASHPVGWGSVTYSLSQLTNGRKNIVLVRLPHLSRFRIIGKPECEDAVQHFTAAIARGIRDRQAV